MGAVGVSVWHPVEGAVVEGLVGADEHHPGLGGRHGARGRVLPVGTVLGCSGGDSPKKTAFVVYIARC